MSFELLQGIIAKFGGEFAPDSLVWSQATNTTVDYQLTMPTKWVAYLLEMSGYTSGEDVSVTFIDHNNIPRWEWTEYLDTQKAWEVLPFLEKFYTGTITFRFQNTATVTRSVAWSTTVILIPEANRIDFEAAVKGLADLIPTLKNIENLLREVKTMG